MQFGDMSSEVCRYTDWDQIITIFWVNARGGPNWSANTILIWKSKKKRTPTIDLLALLHLYQVAIKTNKKCISSFKLQLHSNFWKLEWFRSIICKRFHIIPWGKYFSRLIANVLLLHEYGAFSLICLGQGCKPRLIHLYVEFTQITAYWLKCFPVWWKDFQYLNHC